MDQDPYAAMRQFAEQLLTRTTPETLSPGERRRVGEVLLEMLDALERLRQEMEAMQERERELLDQVATARALHVGALAAVAQWAPRDFN